MNSKEAVNAVTTLVSNPSPEEAGKAVKVLTNYIREVDKLVKSIQTLNETIKSIREGGSR